MGGIDIAICHKKRIKTKRISKNYRDAKNVSI